jgi:hypothetical protein
MAFEAGAVPETLGGAGILVREKCFDEIAEMAHLLVHDEDFRQKVIAGQYGVLEKMDHRDDASLLMSFIEQVVPASAKASAFAKASADRSADKPSRQAAAAAEEEEEGNGG